MYIPLFILSLPAPRLSQFDALVYALTAILKFNIKLLTTSRGKMAQIFHCSLVDFVKLTAVPIHVCISDAAFLIC